jgi:hypothetical protein
MFMVRQVVARKDDDEAWVGRSGRPPDADWVPGGGSSFRRALPRLPTMLAVIWHYWIGVALALGAIATVGALVVGYLRQVESTRYPKGR